MTLPAVGRRVHRSVGRRHRWALAVIFVAALSVGLAACSSGGVDLARQACGHVDKSLALYKQAEEAPTQTEANTLAERAYVQLRTALPLAAMAAASNGQLQALMTTLSETNRVGEQHLITSLRDQCAAAQQSNPAPTGGADRSGTHHPTAGDEHPHAGRVVMGWPGARPGGRYRPWATLGPRSTPTYTVGEYPAGRLMVFFSRNSSRPSSPNSRPIPDSLYPPNGEEKSIGVLEFTM